MKYFYIMAILFLTAACSENEFDQRQADKVSYEVLVGQVDILFVVDNSGSMSEEQTRMAASFPDFVNGLELNGLDYRIGVVTTDMGVQKGDVGLQHGNLLKFPDGSSYLSPQSRNIEVQFAQTIQRQETLVCEQSGYRTEYCPSSDERGVYAAYWALERNAETKFFRENGHTAFIFLTDEDERGGGLNNHEDFSLEARDYPINLIYQHKLKLRKSATMSAHAIVTDTLECKSYQDTYESRGVGSELGKVYMHLTNPDNLSLIGGSYASVTLGGFSEGVLKRGTIGSICSGDYTSELGSVRSVLSQGKSVEKLRCVISEEDKFKVHVDSRYSWTLNSEKNAISFSPALPPGQSFVLEYECY